jgi:hypothetical protein
MSRTTAAFPHARFLLALIALAGAVALMLSLATPTAMAAKPCWERVVDDWVYNGRIDATYPPSCLSAALKNVPEDIRAYSDFEERVKEARQNALRNRFLQGSSSGNTGETPSTTAPRQSQRERIQEREPQVDAPNEDGPIESVLNSGTSDASSVPLPLIILAVLALLMLTAGAAGLAHRKLAARRARR